MLVKISLLLGFAGLVVGLTMQATFNHIDTDKDHHISVTEIEAYCLQLDHNGDGNLELTEFLVGNHTAEQLESLKHQFHFYDTISGVRDHKINCHDDSFTFFGKVDSNGDGVVHEVEYEVEVNKIKLFIAATMPSVGK